MRKIVLGLAAIATLGFAGLGVAGPAHADVSTNGTTKDAQGYAIANHIANFNGDNHGIGHLRSQMTGKQIAAQSGNNVPSVGVDTQGDYAPISNNN